MLADMGSKSGLGKIVTEVSQLFRAEVLANMDDAGSAYTSKDMFAGSKADVDFVQVKTPNYYWFLKSFIYMLTGACGN